RGAWSWELLPGTRPALRELLGAWGALELLPGAEILKANLARTVIALPASARRPSLIVKRYHVRGLRERLKYLALPSRAHREWQALRALWREGIPVPRPLAVGEERAGGILRRAGLIMERIVDVAPAPRALESARGDRERRAELLGAMGALVARLHAFGADHGDLHAGNFLVRQDGPLDGPLATEVHVIDLHAVYLGGVIPRGRRIQNLARLLHSLTGMIDRREERALLDGYQASCGAGEELLLADALSGPLRADLEGRARRLERIRLRSRTRRCWKRSTLFTKERR
ncbi:MAG: lipopolysaccharide kinase InaA family protein, partial [Planctomycetota bacterium]